MGHQHVYADTYYSTRGDIMDINVVLANMPVRIKAYTRKNADLSYTIVLNSAHSREQNEISYKHEMDHIEHGDYDLNCSVGLIEYWGHS